MAAKRYGENRKFFIYVKENRKGRERERIAHKKLCVREKSVLLIKIKYKVNGTLQHFPQRFSGNFC